MGELIPRAGVALEQPRHGPGRPLGQRRKPQLRLAMGYRDEQRHGAPVKTDHFLPRGDDRAVAKFLAEYGEHPRAVDIRLPGTLAGFLDIRHIAFAGGQGGEGGYLRAIGANNFATLGALGGHDVLTVFEKGPDDTGLVVGDLPITGVDDPQAADLGVYLQMVVSFGIPNVLGLGGLCQVTTRGKESIDTLWETAVDIYGQLGSYAMVALRPKLVLKASTMLTPSGVKAGLYVLDLYLPESLDEVYARLERHHALVPAAGAAAAALLYGDSGDEPQAEGARPDKPATPSASVLDDRSLSGESLSTPPAGESPPASPDFQDAEPEPEPEPLEPGSAFAPPADVYSVPVDVAQAGTAVFPSGRFAGAELQEIAETAEGRSYLKWAVANWKTPPEFVDDLKLYVEGLPT